MIGERAIDPITGDYSLLEGGDFGMADDLGNEVYKRIFQVAGEAPLEPKVGRVRRERLKDLDRVRLQLIEDVEQALAPMVEAGRAESVEVEEVEPPSQMPRLGRFYLLVTVTEVGGRVRTFNHWIRVI